MKQKENIILVALILIILIAGTIIMITKGMNFELKYKNSQRIEFNLDKEFEIENIRAITNEVFNNEKVEIKPIEVYKDAVSITATEITEEQKTQLVTKINELYGTEFDANKITVEDIAHTRGRDIIKPYIVPFAISTAIIMLYLLIRYRKLNSLQVLIKTIGIFAIAQLILLCLMTITRMPIGIYTIPFIIIVYMISTYICTSMFEDEKGKLEERAV